MLLCDSRLESVHTTSLEGSGKTRSRRLCWEILAACASRTGLGYWAGSLSIRGEERVKQSSFVGILREKIELKNRIQKY